MDGEHARDAGRTTTRFVVTPDVVLRVVADGTAIPGTHRLVAPTLLRSQVLARLYDDVRAGRLTTSDASTRLDAVRGLRIRLLGDRVLQRVAWRVAEDLGWPDTYDAEYVALTTLQADALVTLDRALADAAAAVVTVAPFEALTAP